jgi:hypothetical protein
MDKAQAAEIAKTYLSQNPAKEKIYIVSDGNAFWGKIAAINYAKTIKGEWYEFPEVAEKKAIEVKEEVKETPKKRTKK